ncbi:MAG TPA: bifunctional helix-turn-helix transcriptional regulator/GNAT family N-acetyltransferase [Burkholderiaceae bacterium]|nr:bifunctional helix-turn-helix transcriptional regulator/GNAT family N-acetyltransferase [Burkholderiaceae bacterium]
MKEPDLEPAVDAVRWFNRWYTQHLGALDEALLQSPFSLAEARVLYELAQPESAESPHTATQLSRTLTLDAGYVSRIVRGLQRRGLIASRPSGADARVQMLRLTDKGRSAFSQLDDGAREQVRQWLQPLQPHDRGALVAALQTTARLLDSKQAPQAPAALVLRPHRAGDMGWVVQRHGVLYAEEYRWDQRFEALVARVVADFIDRFDPARERCWIAERSGERVGSVFVVRKTRNVAQLRLLLVEPSARGAGLGRALVDESIRFAKQAGYRRMVLWTNHVLDAARHIYRRAGFEIVREERHHSFGHELIGETWQIDL